MKTIIKIRFVLLFFLVGVLLLGCQENEFKVVDPNIADAKKWFENNNQKLNQSLNKYQSARAISNFTKSPNWNTSKVHQLKNGIKAVEVILNYENYILFSDSEIMDKSKPNVINSLMLIEVVKDYYELYLLKIYPENSPSGLSVTNFDNLNFSNIPPTFSGKMMLFDWNENLLGGWRIVNGEKNFFYSEISSNNSTENANDLNSRTSTWNCYLLTTYWYSQACTRGGGCADPVLIDITTTQMCEYVLAPGDDSGAGGPGDPTANTCFIEHTYINGLMVPCVDANAVGNKPLYEYNNKCQGLQDIWNNFPNNEMFGYITSDGKLIVTNQQSFTGGSAFGTYSFNGVTYYPYPVSQGAPSQSYSGMITTNTYYFIPVVASVHTHSPCRSDGTNGVSHSVGADDISFASSHPQLNHWVIGCNAIAQYNATSSSFFNIQSGSLSTSCNAIN